MTPQQLYEAGRLQDAIAAATEQVRQHPTDGARRSFLAELLCFAGDFERADRQLDALGSQAPEAVLAVGVLRQLLRAEQARQQLYTEGRVPEFLAPPTPALRQHLQALVCLRDNQPAEAARLLDEADAQRPRPAGTCDGQAFDDFRDTDDLTACLFEVLTGGGKYYWVPAEAVELIEFRPWQRPHDLLWRRAHMVVRGGPDGEVFIPALYPGAAAEADDRLRLGRITEWRGGEGAPLRGAGQRVFAVGGEDRPILEIQSLAFNAPKE
jgi:type VI secretion system protein ImpE